MDSQDNKKEKIPYKGLALKLFLFILAIWALFPIALKFVFNEYVNTASNFGTFGDSFGALNTLFSGFAFAGIIVSIFLQSQELRETRKEFEKQNETLSTQIFENKFFQLLNLYQDLVKSLSWRSSNSGKIITEGREVFRLMSEAYLHFEINNGEDVRTNYDIFYEAECEANVGHYFRSLYHILKYVDQSEVLDKKFYTNLLRAQISNLELQMIFINCLGTSGELKDKPLMEKYSFFEHLPHEDRLNHDQLFHPNAFGDNAFQRVI